MLSPSWAENLLNENLARIAKQRGQTMRTAPIIGFPEPGEWWKMYLEY
jgi:hypothetical protein